MRLLRRAATSGTTPAVANHLLKVFLIDPQLWVREIYSVATLDQVALVNDMRTVAGEGSNRG